MTVAVQPLSTERAAVRPRTLRPLPLGGALTRFRGALRASIARGGDEARQARRREVLVLVERVADAPDADSIGAFERVVNGALDRGYRARPLAAFIFDALHRRLAGRIRRRLRSSGQDPDCAEVSDLVAAAAEGIHKLVRGARRERHTVRYALLMSFADHRTIDFLRRRRPEYHETLDDRSVQADDSWAYATTAEDPEQRLCRAQRQQLARRLRGAVLAAVNALSDRERAALVLVEIDGHGYDEVASRLCVKRTDVGNVVRRARLKRDRALVPLLRAVDGLDGHIGFSELQARRDLRLNMLGWTAEMGDGLCAGCRDSDWHLHPLETPCP